MGISRAGWVVAACGAIALAATRTDLYVPLPAGVPLAAVTACFLALPLALGLAVARGWVTCAALCLVVVPDSRPGSAVAVDVVAGIVLLTLLIASGVAVARVVPRSRVAAVPLALAGLLPLAVGAFRTVAPYDHVPDQRLVVDERLGRIGAVRLGDVQMEERRILDAEYESASANGRVIAIWTNSPHAQTSRGVGNGDNLALVKERYPRAFCVVSPASGEYPTSRFCVLRVGKVEVQFYDDPIRSVTVQRTRRP